MTIWNNTMANSFAMMGCLRRTLPLPRLMQRCTPFWQEATAQLSSCPRSLVGRTFSASPISGSDASHDVAGGQNRPPTGVVMMNMGGPSYEEEVGPFLTRLFTDRDIMELPFQSWSGPLISKRRTPHVKKLYKDIGMSPIRRLSEAQGDDMIRVLDKISPKTGPHKNYLAFRYADPMTDEALMKMKEDGVTRAVAFSQYPHWSCSTTGSSLNELWRRVRAHGLDKTIQWSIIDRWSGFEPFIEVLSNKIVEGLQQFDNDADRNDAVVLYSAHGLPMKVVARGDNYPHEIANTKHRVMERLGKVHNVKNHSVLCWQSKVGPLPWLTPNTAEVIERLGKRGQKNILVVPIAFTTDHIETLSEIDVEYKELANEHGIKNFKRSPALNADPAVGKMMAGLVKEHLQSGEAYSSQYKLRCPGCVKDYCREIVNPVL